MAILRTFACDDCATEFDSWDDSPDCPACAETARYVPRGGRIQHAATQNTDAIAKTLMSEYGLTNMNSNTREGEAAAQLTTSQSQMMEMSRKMTPQGNVGDVLRSQYPDRGSKELRELPFQALQQIKNK